MALAEDVLDRAAALREQGVRFVVATVVRVKPPTSARPGDKALITDNGQLWGWIGGSCSEALVRREALVALQDGQPRLVKIAPDSAPELEPGVVSHVSTCPSAGSLDVFIDPQVPRPLLLVTGDTPAARTLLRLGTAVGFRTCAVHPGAGAADFPEAAQVIDTLDLSGLASGDDTWAVVATMGHYDEDALAAVLKTGAAYVGLIASRRRRQAVLDLLGTMGVKDLDRVRRPADSAVAASQEEIALAVLSEIVAERRTRRSAPAFGHAVGTPSEAGSAIDPICGMSVVVAEAVHTLRRGDELIVFCTAQCRESFRAQAAVG
ncbi:MAG TPA: XdhC family protein [Candidatus Limnocylindrales bacterium]|nr:XdhC family protein [Candidatus Limnocylindrales bacterium]